MALTTASAFDEFKAKLQPTSTQTQTIESRRAVTQRYLSESFGSSSNLPLVQATLIGSASRGTIIRPLDDVDVLAEFSNAGNMWEAYRYDSKAFLYRVRDALAGYRVEIVGARGQAVRLFYASAPHVDIAPVFRYSNGSFALPNGSGGWLTTEPSVHNAFIDKRHQELAYNLKPLIRLLKRWNSVHSKYLKSFHLELLVASSFSSLGSNSRQAAEIFFRYTQTHLSVQDPAGHSGDMAGYLTSTNRQNVIANLEAARERAARANVAESSGDHREAIRLWRIVFGDEFPTYG